jgi:putative transposase
LAPLYIRDPFYFITCCAYRGRPILANAAFHNAFMRFAEHAQLDFVIAVGRYVILPDHLHFFVSLGEDKSLAKWMGTLKRVVGSAIKPIDSSDPVWQRGFFDHVMRSADSYSQKWNYVRDNPVRAGLAKSSEEWPYCGEIVRLAYN